MLKKLLKPVGVLENHGAPQAEARGMCISTMTGGTIGGDVKEVEGENTKTGSGIGGVEGGVVVKGGGVTERRGVTGRG